MRQSPRLEGALSGCVMDACVPFPRTSGARFNHVGILVTFSQAINSKGISLKHQNTTPRFVRVATALVKHFYLFLIFFRFPIRALSALSGGYLGMGSQPVLYAHHRDPNSTAFYLHDRVRVGAQLVTIFMRKFLINFLSEIIEEPWRFSEAIVPIGASL